MSIITLVPRLLKHPIFEGIDESVISKYLCEESFTVQTFEPSSVIISPDELNSPISIVISGTVEILCNNSNHKVLLKTSGAGTVFGVANLYADNQTFPSIVSAKTETKVLMVDKKIFKSMLVAEPEILNNFLAFLSNKVIYLNKKIASYTAGNNEKKLAYFLSENQIDGIVSTEVSISDIAVMLNMGRASLYRAFDKFESENIISRDGRTIHITNLEKLKKYI